MYDGRGSVAAELSCNTAWYTLGGALSDKSVITKSYTPFGEQLTEETSGFGYNGEYYNAATGTVYLRARFYEPEMNRFSQKDVVRGIITNPNSLNRYSYVQNDPINFIDPSGESLRSLWNNTKNFVNNTVKKVGNFVNNTISKVKNIFSGGSKPTSSAGSASNTIVTNTQTGSSSTTCSSGSGSNSCFKTRGSNSPSVKNVTFANICCNGKTFDPNKTLSASDITGILSSVSSFLYGVVKTTDEKVLNKAAESLRSQAYYWNSNGFIDAPIIPNLEKSADLFSEARRASALSGVSTVISAVIDGFVQIKNSDSVSSALSKTGGHVIVGLAGSAVAGTIAASAPVAITIGVSATVVYVGTKLVDRGIDYIEENTNIFSKLDKKLKIFD